MAANAGVERLRATFKSVNDVVFGGENLLVIYLGALLILDGRMTIGMLFAFVAYKQQFVDKADRVRPPLPGDDRRRGARDDAGRSRAARAARVRFEYDITHCLAAARRRSVTRPCNPTRPLQERTP